MSNTSNRSKTKVLLLDCCYSAAFTRGGIKGNENNDVIESFRGSGTYVISASNATLPAHEEDENNKQSDDIHSIFTRAIVKGIETGAADLDKDANISLDELYDYVYEQVQEVKPEQTPQKSSFDTQGKILIAKNPVPISTSVDVIGEDSEIKSPVELLYTLPLDKTDNLAWSPDGTMLASSKNNTIYIWNGETGKLISEIETENNVIQFVWSNDSSNIATISIRREIVLSSLIQNTFRFDRTSKDDRLKQNYLSIYKIKTGKLADIFLISQNDIEVISWSPDNKIIAFIDSEQCICFYNFSKDNQEAIPAIPDLKEPCIAWSPDSTILIAGDENGFIKFWDVSKREFLLKIQISSEAICCIEWSADNQFIAIASRDNLISIFDVKQQKNIALLEGHSNKIIDLSFSYDTSLLSSCEETKTLIWRCSNWSIVLVIEKVKEQEIYISGYSQSDFILDRSKKSYYYLTGIDPLEEIVYQTKLDKLLNKFNQTKLLLATNIGVWKIKRKIVFSLIQGKVFDIERKFLQDKEELLTPTIRLEIIQTEYYTNAKIVLVGDSGVGKSGLGLVLTGQEFKATESTHGRHVWTLEDKNLETSKGRTETHETLLWDLAGQPGYRLIHQLHLNEVAVALIVFDARSETDPFTGVRHWERALRQARRLQNKSASPLKKYLVAARSDRGGIGVSRQRIDKIVKDLEFDGYFETSAKEGWQIPQLIDQLQQAIDWENIPTHPILKEKQ